ncbi:MAG: 50S ribosomal protein L3 N(5)-glutamine methyltransferase [Gammaproteobacteria bacterium]
MTTSQASTLRRWLEWAEQHFAEHGLYYGHGTDNAQDEALYLIRYVLKDDFDHFCEHPNQDLSSRQNQAIQALLEKRISSRKPAAYLVQEAWFAGYTFYVDERVLVPRSPLAELIETEFVPWIDIDKVTNILDIGTGSGCIAIACALYYPDVRVDAVDLHQDALDVAKINVARYQLESRVRLYQADIYDGLPAGQYDIIISNPPYVSQQEMQDLPEEYCHEPETGLVAGEDGLDCVRKILYGAADYLSQDGILFVEVGNSQQAVEQTWPDVPFVWLEFEYGGDGVFMLEARQLSDFRELFKLKSPV